MGKKLRDVNTEFLEKMIELKKSDYDFFENISYIIEKLLKKEDEM